MIDIRYATVGAVVLAFILAAVVARASHALIHRILRALDIVGAENREAVHARARQLTRALTILAYGVAALASISLALERLGVNEPQWNPRQLGHWTLTHGVNLVIIFVGAFIVVRGANLAIDRFQFKLSRRRAAPFRAPTAMRSPGRPITRAATSPGPPPMTWSTEALRRARRMPTRPRPLSATTITPPARHTA